MTSVSETPVVTGESVVVLCPVGPGDEQEFLARARASTSLHRPWVVAPTSSAAFAEYLERFATGAGEGQLIRLRASGELVGFVNLNEIVLGPYRRGLLGYAAFAGGAGRGYIRQGLQLMMAHAFADLGLHRLEADIQPGNLRSANLVRGLGFRLEGTSPGFIRINGHWRDHDRWAANALPDSGLQSGSGRAS